MITRKRVVIAFVAITTLSQCASGFGQGSQTQRVAAASPSGVRTQRQVMAIRHLKWPQSAEAMARRFGPPDGISRDDFSSEYLQHYADRVQPVSVRFRLDGVAIGIAGEGQ